MTVALNRAEVNVTRESEWRRQQRICRTCFSNIADPKWISVEELYAVLDHGEPGEYILKGT